MANEHNKTEDKKATSIHNSRKQPLKSGQVKGPMGIGKKKEPSTRATVKEPAKGKTSPEHDPGVSKISADGVAKKQGSSASNLSPAPSLQDDSMVDKHPKERLPERTSKESEALRIVESKRKRKEAQVQHEMASGEPINLSESTQTEMRGMENSASTQKQVSQPDKTKEPGRPSENKDKSSSQDTSQEGSKKMSRQKFVKGISAEEKLKLDNVSPSQELQSRVADTTKGLWEALDPGQEIKDEIAEILLQVIPSKEKLASSTPSKEEMKKIAEVISGMFEKGRNMDEILAAIPNEKIREQIREIILTARNNRG